MFAICHHLPSNLHPPSYFNPRGTKFNAQCQVVGWMGGWVSVCLSVCLFALKGERQMGGRAVHLDNERKAKLTTAGSGCKVADSDEWKVFETYHLVSTATSTAVLVMVDRVIGVSESNGGDGDCPSWPTASALDAVQVGTLLSIALHLDRSRYTILLWGEGREEKRRDWS